jgi:hypothetical protein
MAISFGSTKSKIVEETSEHQAANKLGIDLSDISATTSVKTIISEETMANLNVALNSCMVTDQVIKEELSKM